MNLIDKVRRVVRSAYYHSRSTYHLVELPFKRHTLNASVGLERLDPLRPIYVFFAPEAGVSPHFVADCLIAKTLQELGHQVLMVRCFDIYHHCQTIEMVGITLDRSRAQKADVCINCAESGLKMTRSYNLPTVTLNDLLTHEDLQEIKSQIKTMPTDAGQFEIDGVRFGTLCGMDVALLTKKLDQLNVTGVDRAYLEAYVEAAMISYRAMQKLLARYRVARLLFFNEYSILIGAVTAAQKHGTPVGRISLAIHRNLDRSKIILMSDPLAIINYHDCLDRWPQWRSLPLPPKTVELITDNQLARMGDGGSSVYSPKFTAGVTDVFAQMRMDPQRKLLVAYTSSMDEYFSNIHLMASIGIDLFQRAQPFVDQITWIAALIDYVERSPHLQLVVRIHPREGKTARENVASEHRDILAARFSEKYQHARIIWPEESISSYDLAEVADVALTSWTNITSEIVRLGVPTITAFKRVNPFPVDDMVGWAPTPDSYFELLEHTLQQTFSLNTIMYAYRWSHAAFLSSYVDMGDVVPSYDYQGLPPYRLPAAAPLIERVVCGGESLQQMRYEELLAAAGDAAEKEEIDKLKQQLRRVVWYLITCIQPEQDYKLRAGAVGEAAEDEVVVELEGEFVKIAIQGRIIKKRSKAIARLLPFITNDTV